MDLFVCLEGLVLAAFVRVHGFVLRSFSVVSSASARCQLVCLQRNAATTLPVGGGQLSCPARVGSDPGKQLGTSVRSAGRSRWGIVETALSTVVLGYATNGTVDSLFGQDIEAFSGEVARDWVLFPLVLLCIGCTVFTGMSYLVCPLKSQGAISNTASVNAGEMNCLGRGGWADCLGVDGVDLHECHYVITVASHISRVISVWILFVCFGLLVASGVVLFLMLCYHFPLGPTLWSILAVYLFASFVTFFLCGVTGRIWKSAGVCRTQPFHFHARPLLLVSSMAYAVLLYVSPVSSAWWRWILVATHTTRALKVLASLRGRSEVMMKAGGEDAGDMP